MKCQKLKLRGIYLNGARYNPTVTILQTITVITFIAGAFLGFLCGHTCGELIPYQHQFIWFAAVPIWFLTIIAGTVLLAFSEIVSLLQAIQSQEFEGYTEKSDDV